jgi:RNA polymerase sigma-70 factor (ECF subfamily)
MRDVNEFDEFYGATGRRVVAQVYAMIGDLAEAEDAVQEAYSRAWQRWETVRDYTDPASWVRVVAYRIAVSSWRRARGRLAAHRRSGLPPDEAELSPDTVALVAALRRIPAAQRRAIVLYHLADLSVREVADETGATESAVKAQLSRGRQALAQLLGDDERQGVGRHE